ncbi:MAG: XTP/dITP diphosphatase [Phycisphaerae bacterium]|nr:XTP/dITP diphosphatase [Phycisphaerae bacterium]
MTRKEREIVVATTNPGKLAEINQLLDEFAVRICSLADFGSVEEAVEDKETFTENARKKAQHYSSLLDRWVLADDSGLEVEALGGQPGVYSARFAQAETADRKEQDRANNEKLIKLLDGVSVDKRGARFCCHLCLVNPAEMLLEVEGHVDGVITETPVGELGFGYDPYFYVPTRGKTAAQMDYQEKNSVSHRGRALRKLLEKLPEILNNCR